MHFVNILTYKYPFYIIFFFLFQTAHTHTKNARHIRHLFLEFFVYFANFRPKFEAVSSYYKCITLTQKKYPCVCSKTQGYFSPLKAQKTDI